LLSASWDFARVGSGDIMGIAYGIWSMDPTMGHA